jgi:hypothetical protein
VTRNPADGTIFVPDDNEQGVGDWIAFLDVEDYEEVRD